MNGLAIGGFFSGAGEGFDQQMRTQVLQAKDAREKEAHGLAIQNAQMDIAAKKDEVAYRDELKLNMAEIANLSKPQQITDPATGQVTQKPGLDPMDAKLMAADKLHEIGLRYGKVGIKELQEASNFRREAQAEGAMDALRYAYANPNDQEGIKKIFNEKGKVKIGDDIQLVQKPGLYGNDIIGVRTGKDGKQVEVFNSFRDIILPSLSPDKAAAMMGEFKKTEMTEAGATYRTGMQTGSAERVASSNQRANAALKGREWERDDRKYIQSQTTSNIANGLRSPTGGMQPERLMQIENEIGAKAEFLQRHNPAYRDNPSAAMAEARNYIYKREGISTAPLQPPKK